MPFDRPISDEQLNAFVDNQLNKDEKDQILAAISQDEDLSHRACEARRLTELVQHAYEFPPQAPSELPPARRLSLWGQGIAACLLIALGAIGGWLSHSQQVSHLNPLNDVQAMYLDEEKAFQSASLEQAPTLMGARKILLHISSDDPQKMEAALNMAEEMLTAYRVRKVPVELELVANAGGLNLLRADTSPFADRVERMQMKFDELTFFACQTAMSRLLAREGMSELPPLLPEALTTPNALEQILTRLQEGWVYISV